MEALRRASHLTVVSKTPSTSKKDRLRQDVSRHFENVPHAFFVVVADKEGDLDDIANAIKPLGIPDPGTVIKWFKQADDPELVAFEAGSPSCFAVVVFGLLSRKNKTRLKLTTALDKAKVGGDGYVIFLRSSKVSGKKLAATFNSVLRRYFKHETP